MGFQTGSDHERITEIQKQLDDVIDSQLYAVSGNSNIPIDSTRGARNDAGGDAGGVRSNQPIIHQITDVDSGGVSTGVFDKINIISSMAIIDNENDPNGTSQITLRFIQGTAKDGARITVTPKFDITVAKTLIIRSGSGGNILANGNIRVTDKEVFELIKFPQSETGVVGGAWKVSKI